MTLLEALLATVILSVVAVACLEGTRGAATLQRTAASTALGVAQADAVMAQVLAGAPVASGDARVRRGRYASGRSAPASHLDRVDVEVPVAGGGVVQLTRLVRRPSERPQ